MAITASSPIREHERPMSWARAVLLAIGFFFVVAILLGQLPSYVYTIVTLSSLARMELGFLDLGLLALGLGAICFEICWLYDPKPLIPWPLFAGLGAVIGLVGAFLDYQVLVGINGTDIFGFSGWAATIPFAIQHGTAVSYWPAGNPGYLFNPGWLQTDGIGIGSIGLIGIITGLGMLLFAVLCPFVLGGRLVGATRDLLVRGSLGLAIVIAAIWLTTYTFAPNAIAPTGSSYGAVGNIFLFAALALALFALVVWLLPIMVANRQQFMPAVYLHGVVGLIGMVAVPLILIWVIVFPVVNAIHSADSAEFWVQCSQKTYIPGSCTFSQFTGYIICAIVFSNLFALCMAGLYFWSTRRNTVVLGGTIGLVFVALAVLVVHSDVLVPATDAAQVSMGFIIAIGILVLAFFWTWATQREFAPVRVSQLGCLGQWLVLGTLLIVFLVGYAFLSLPTFFELESGFAFFYVPGPGQLHDAYWVLLILCGLGFMHFVLLVRRGQPFSNARKFVLASLLTSAVLLIASAVMGFTTDVLSQGVNAMTASDAVAVSGMAIGLAGLLVALYGAVRARGLVSGWSVAIVGFALVGIAEGYIAYYLPGYWAELTIFGFILAMVGGYAYAAAGPDAPLPGEDEYTYLNGNGHGPRYGPTDFAITRE